MTTSQKKNLLTPEYSFFLLSVLSSGKGKVLLFSQWFRFSVIYVVIVTCHPTLPTTVKTQYIGRRMANLTSDVRSVTIVVKCT